MKRTTTVEYGRLPSPSESESLERSFNCDFGLDAFREFLTWIAEWFQNDNKQMPSSHQRIFDWQRDFKKKHDLTTFEFLREMDIDPTNSALRELTDSNIVEPDLSLYGELKEKMEYFEEHELKLRFKNYSPTEKIHDYLQINKQELNDVGVQNILITNADEDDLCLTIVATSGVNEKELKDSIMRVVSPVNKIQIDTIFAMD